MGRIILVSGAVANKCRNGGEAWVRLSWAMGLRRLGFDVYLVEQIGPQACVDQRGAAAALADSVNLEYFRAVTGRFGFAERASLVYAAGSECGALECAGVGWGRLVEIAESAELLVNISGHLTLRPLLDRVCRKAYVDIDPGFTQFWHADSGTAFEVGGHDFYFTIGENIGAPDCPIPTGGIDWRPVRQPVVLDDWPVSPTAEPGRFTTVASWRGAYGPVAFGGQTYGVKAHEFRKFLALPGRVGLCGKNAPVFEIALDIQPGDAKDSTALRENGWRVIDPRAAAGDPETFRRYVQASGAEFSVAQGMYVDTGSGWFSDRTVRYLASGKPVLVQETGFGRNLPTGDGLVAFRTLDEAIVGVGRILGDYAAHCAAARAVAEQCFDSDRVLGRFLDEVGVG